MTITSTFSEGKFTQDLSCVINTFPDADQIEEDNQSETEVKSSNKTRTNGAKLMLSGTLLVQYSQTEEHNGYIMSKDIFKPRGKLKKNQPGAGVASVMKYLLLVQ